MELLYLKELKRICIVAGYSECLQVNQFKTWASGDRTSKLSKAANSILEFLERVEKRDVGIIAGVITAAFSLFKSGYSGPLTRFSNP